MKRGHLIIIYFVMYLSVLVMISLKLATFEIARRELMRIDNAIEIAGERTARALNEHVYEEDIMELLNEVFVHTYSAMMNETESEEVQHNRALIDRMYIGINGVIAEPSALMSVRDSDSLYVYIVLNDICIETPFRAFVISREYFKETERQ